MYLDQYYEEDRMAEVVLYHHAPTHNDDQMDAIAKLYLAKGAARGIDVATAFEGMTLPIGDHDPGKDTLP